MPALPSLELPVADRVALGALAGALLQARATDDGRPALAIVAVMAKVVLRAWNAASRRTGRC